MAVRAWWQGGHGGREGTVAGRARWQMFEVGKSHCIDGQELEREQEVGLDYPKGWGLHILKALQRHHWLEMCSDTPV